MKKNTTENATISNKKKKKRNSCRYIAADNIAQWVRKQLTQITPSLHCLAINMYNKFPACFIKDYS